MMLDYLEKQLIRHEGMRTKPYTDTVGKLTIGCGRNLTDRGLSDEEIAYLLNNDINECFRQLDASFPWFFGLDVVRQRVFVDLCFMGIGKLRGFVKMLAAIDRHNAETPAGDVCTACETPYEPCRWDFVFTQLRLCRALGLDPYAPRQAALASSPATRGGAVKARQLKVMLTRSARGDWPSRVNPGMTHTQALDILTRGVAAFADDHDMESTARAHLIERNVLRECRDRSAVADD